VLVLSKGSELTWDIGPVKRGSVPEHFWNDGKSPKHVSRFDQLGNVRWPVLDSQPSAPAVSSTVRPFAGDAEAGLFSVDPVDDFLAVWYA
jgi:hypothetical protein